MIKRSRTRTFIQAKDKMKSYIKANYKNIKHITYDNDYKIDPMGNFHWRVLEW